MALIAEEEASNLVRADSYFSRRAEAARAPYDPDNDREPELSAGDRETVDIASACLRMLEDGIKAREPFETFDEAWDAFIGNMWPARYPVWKGRITVNKIRAFIVFMQAVMTDNKPRVNVEPTVPGSEHAAKVMGRLMDRDWDEGNLQDKFALSVLYGLIWGTGFLKTTYNPRANGGKGKHETHAVVPYRIFTNSTSTSIEDARFIIHVEDQPLGWIAENYPDTYAKVKRHKGARLNREKGSDSRDYIREGNTSDRPAGIQNPIRTTMNTVVQPHAAKRGVNDDDGETIEVAEFWFRDESTESYQRPKLDVNGEIVLEDVLDEYGLPVLEVAGTQIKQSPLDGLPYAAPVYRHRQKPVMMTDTRAKFPNGRLVVMAGPVVMRDIPNPYQTDGFPFAKWCNQDVGAFWGQPEPLALKDLNIAINRTLSQVFDILEKTGNPSFKYKKGSGLELRSLRNKPGSIIPLDEMDALQPLGQSPVQPAFMELVTMLKTSMGEVAGLRDAIMGELPGGNTSFATVDSLQESGAAPLRQKVRNSEGMLKRYGKLRIQLIQQYDRGDRPIRTRVEVQPETHIDEETGEEMSVPAPASSIDYKFDHYSNADLQGVLDFAVVPDSSLSSSPAGLKNWYLQLYDKHIVDRRAVIEKLHIDDGEAILKRITAEEAMRAMAKQKPGPKPSRPPRAGRKPSAPPQQVPSRLQNSSIR